MRDKRIDAELKQMKCDIAEKACLEWDHRYGWIRSSCVYDNVMSDIEGLLNKHRDVVLIDMYPREFVLHILEAINEGYYKPEELDETYRLWLTEWSKNAKK